MKLILSILCWVLLAACSNQKELPKTTFQVQTGMKILALGDSLTAGYWLDLQDAYPQQLQNLFPGSQVINAWKSWDTSAQLLERLEFSLEGENFSTILLCIGANDGLQGKSLSELETNLKQIIERLKRTEAKIIFFGMQIPPNLWVQYARDFAAIYPRLAKKYQLVFFPFFLEWVAAQPQYNLSDGIHPNAQGYAVIVKNISDIIRNPHAYQK